MRYLLSAILVLFSCLSVQAAPVLRFSDLTSGPATGLGDGLGSGAIVTIWGQNLGSSQGSSTLSICGQSPAHIYYWKNADGQLPGGPAELYTSHKMQEIAFSIPSGCSTGATTISATIGGITSNTLPFTVRTGRILHVKSGGIDNTSTTGTWAAPFATAQYVLRGGNGRVQAGDVIYTHGIGATTGLAVGLDDTVAGTVASPIALTSYPNTLAAFSGKNSNTDAVITNFYPSSRNNNYVHFSKIKVTSYGNNDDTPNGFSVVPHGRIIGVEITGPHVYQGMGGAITGTGGVPQDGKYIGVYMHDYGYANGWTFVADSNAWDNTTPDGIAGIDCTTCTTVNNLQHLYYVSCRVDGLQCEAYEIGWNHLKDNPILESIHIYDMGTSGWQGEMLIHDNVLNNQTGFAIDIEMTTANTADLKVWNNLIINTNGQAFNLNGVGSGTAYYYNNTVYNQTIPSIFNSTSAIFKGNIFVDTLGIPVGTTSYPSVISNNLSYSSVGVTQPSWLTSSTGHVVGNPQFTDAANGDFSIASTSPAINAGYDHSFSTLDIGGNTRSGVFDIGAFEYSLPGGGSTTYLGKHATGGGKHATGSGFILQ